MDIELDAMTVRQQGFSLFGDVTITAASTAIIGPSGEGKSTLLLTLAGFIAPVSGRILFDRVDFTAAPPAGRPVTLLFQEHNLFPHLSVFQNTALGIRPDLRLARNEIGRVEDALGKVGLGNHGNRQPSTLSGGQRQRVALARALLREKPVMLLDEPFAALGPALRHEMLDLVAEICADQGTTLLLVTHNPDDARRITQDSVLVAGGVVHAPRDTAEMFDDPPPALAEYLGT